jgi:hypothetical protein
VSVLDYFRIRKAWEAKERVASADVVLLKEAQVQYSGHEFEELYDKCCHGGITNSQLTQSSVQSRRSGKFVFRTMICSSSLSIFSDPHWNCEENCVENESVDDSSQNSGAQPVQLSRM